MMSVKILKAPKILLAFKVGIYAYLRLKLLSFSEIEAQARIRLLEEEVALARKEKDLEENCKNKALQEVQVCLIYSVMIIFRNL